MQEDGKGKGTPRKMHSYPGRPAKHEWAKCLENPVNQKKPATKRAEAYYAHDKRCPASDASSLSDHRTALASDKSSKGYSGCLDYSDDKDNFAVSILALPRKQTKHDVLPSKKKLTITMSSRTRTLTTTQHWPNLVSWRHRTPQIPRWGRNTAVPRSLSASP